MKLRFAAATATAAIVAVMGQAQATPYAGQFEYLTTGTVTVRGADGARWMLAITATASGIVESRAEQQLYIDLTRCAGDSCVAVGKWSRSLNSREVQITTSSSGVIDTEATSGELTTVLGGVPLEVSLFGTTVGGAGFSGLGSSTSPPGIKPSFVQFVSADGHLEIGGVHCSIYVGHGSVIGRSITVDTVGDDARDPRVVPPAHLPTGFLTGKGRAHC